MENKVHIYNINSILNKKFDIYWIDIVIDDIEYEKLNPKSIKMWRTLTEKYFFIPKGNVDQLYRHKEIEVLK